MNKEELRRRKKAKESIIEYRYMVKNGREKLSKYEQKIRAVSDNDFKPYSVGEISIPFDHFDKWKTICDSINHHVCSIYLTQDENIENYLSEAREIIADKLQEDIKEIEKTIDLLKNNNLQQMN